MQAAEQTHPPSKTGADRLRHKCNQPLTHAGLEQVDKRPASRELEFALAAVRLRAAGADSVLLLAVRGWRCGGQPA